MSARVLSLAIAIISASVVTTTLATAGRAVASERSVLARIDDSDVSTIEVIDDDGLAGLDADTVRRLASLNTAAWALGLGPVEDVRVSGIPGAEPVAARRIVGGSPALRFPPDFGDRPVAFVGDVSAAATGLVDGAGSVDSTFGAQLPVVGSFSVSAPLTLLHENVLVRDPEWSGPVRRVFVQVERPEDVLVTATAVQQMLPESEGARARVVVASDLAVIRAAVRGELGGAGRATVLQTLAAGLVLGGLTIYAGLQARRKDFGRRRALGASRWQLTTMVVLQVMLAAIPGAILGALGGQLAVWWIADENIGWRYPTAVVLLTLGAMAAAGLIPATTAAWRDPVAALRVP